MIPELKEFSKKNKEEKLRAENAVYVCNQIDNLIKNSVGKSWVPILSLPQKPIAVICRASEISPNDDVEPYYFYFCSEFTLTRGWVDFPSDDPAGNTLDWFDMENVEALV
jgi:hypothetical protein